MAVSKTTNSGSSWTRYDLAAAGYTYALAVNPSTSNIIYAGGDPGLYKTTNSGANWINISTGITGLIYALAIDPSATSTVYAGTPNGVFKSTNAGTSWTNTGCSNVNAIIIDPDAPDTLYAGTITGVFRSITGGGNWTAMNQGLDELDIASLGIHPANYLYAGTNGKGLYRWNLNVGIEENGKENSESFFLFARPNPFITKTEFRYLLPKQANIVLTIYDTQGRIVRNLLKEEQNAGMHTISWNGCDNKGNLLASGVYFYELSVNDEGFLKKLVLLK